MRDYWIVTDKTGLIIGSAETKAGRVAKHDVLATYLEHYPGAKCFSVAQEVYTREKVRWKQEFHSE